MRPAASFSYFKKFGHSSPILSSVIGSTETVKSSKYFCVKILNHWPFKRSSTGILKVLSDSNFSRSAARSRLKMGLAHNGKFASCLDQRSGLSSGGPGLQTRQVMLI